MRQWHWNHTSFHVSPILYFFSPCTTLFPHTLCAYAPTWICVHPLAHVCTPMCTHSQVIFNVAELSESGNNVTLHVEASQGMVLKNMSALAMLTPLWIYSISFSMNHGAEILNIILILIFFPPGCVTVPGFDFRSKIDVRFYYLAEGAKISIFFPDTAFPFPTNVEVACYEITYQNLLVKICQAGLGIH